MPRSGKGGQALLEVVELELQRVQRRSELVARDREEDVAHLDPLLGLPEQPLPLGLGFLPAADVASDLGGAHDPADRVLDRRHRQGNGDFPSGFREPDRFVVIDALAAPDPAENGFHVVVPLFRHEHGDRFPDDLVRRVPEEPLGRAVPRRDGAVQRLGDDRVVGRLHDRLESPGVAAERGNVDGEHARMRRRSDGPAAVRALELRLLPARVVHAHASSLLPSFLISVSRTATRLS